MINLALLVAAKLLAGWLLADLLGGVLHWLEDRVLSPSLPLIGRHVVVPNRRHHAEPMAFVAGSFIARNGTTWAAAGIVSAVWALTLGPSIVWAAATVGGMVSSIVHYWTHVPPPAGSLMRVLQDIGVIQSVRQHAQHHRPPGDRRYCALTDWLNPVLDHLDVWGRAERLLRIPAGRAT